MARGGVQAQAADVLSDGTSGDRFVDMRIVLREWGDSRATIMDVGGRWDRARREWSDDGNACAIWRVQPSQYEAAYFFRDWFRAYCRGERVAKWEDIYVLLCAGGRGAGKSDFGVKAGVMLATGKRDRIVWMVSPVEPETRELQDVIERETPSSFYVWQKSELTYFFWNGSRIAMMSGYDPGTLKRGRVDYFLLNEAQRFPKDAYKMVRPRLADTGGLGYLAANPPRDAKGRWVMEFHDQAKGGALPGVRLFEFDPAKNPVIDRRALEVLRPEFGDEDYRREILGEMLPIGDLVFYAWSDLLEIGNVRPAPALGNCTRALTTRVLGREFDQVIGLDFQLAPYMGGAVTEFFANPDEPDRPFSWYTGELVVSGTEDDLCDELEARGYDPQRTALICDASAWWQDSERTKGRGSIDILRGRGWRFCFRPDRTSKSNPAIMERVLATNARFKSSDGRMRAFSVPENVQLNRALKLWENRNGAPNRRSEFAHLSDAASYVQWRFFPRRTKRKAFEYQGGDREKSSRERELDDMV